MEFLRLGSKGGRCLSLYDIEWMSFLLKQTRFNNEEEQREIIVIIRI